MTGSTKVHQSRARLSYSLSYQQDQIAKKTEQMTALLLLSNALSPMRLDESRGASRTEDSPALKASSELLSSRVDVMGFQFANESDWTYKWRGLEQMARSEKVREKSCMLSSPICFHMLDGLFDYSSTRDISI